LKGKDVALNTTTRENGTRRVQSVNEEPSRTEQSHRKAVNINTIVAKARRGVPPRINAREGLYGDFTSGMDYQTMLNKMHDAVDDFMALPAKTRELFGNDVSKLLDFIANPENEEQARDLGLLPEKNQGDEGVFGYEEAYKAFRAAQRAEEAQKASEGTQEAPPEEKPAE
jgi:phage internal scaffolding protein